MALGEAFINVRADLAPFAKDLEKGVRKILREAEKKIAAEAGTGRSIGNAIGKETQRGVSDGIDRGMDDGFKKGAQKAAKSAQGFLATLGDFVDDGLSAIPPKVKAAIVIGVVAAAAVAAPLLASLIAGAITLGVGLGITTLGVVLASRLQVVTRQFSNLGTILLDRLTTAASHFAPPLVAAAETILNVFERSFDRIDEIFGQASLLIAPLTEAFLGFIQALLPGISALVKASRPIVEMLRTSLPQLGQDIATAFEVIATAAPEATLALADLINWIGIFIIATAGLIAALAKLYGALRIVGAVLTGDFKSAMALMVLSAHDSNLASGQLVDGLDNLDIGLNSTASKALAAKLAISDLTKTMLASLDSTIGYEQAIDDLADSIKSGNKDFDVRHEKGRTNLRLVKQAIENAALQRDTEISRAQETGRSIDSINADYQKEIATIQKVIGKNGDQSQSLKDVFAEAKKLPTDVAIEVQTPGLAAALRGFRTLGSVAAAAARIAANAINTANGGSGLRTAKQYALGGIVTAPTNAIIGEAGYKEAVIPDPAVMPGRAMQLSNQLGLTSLIAKTLGAAQTVVNVFIGQQRLEQIADYRIGVNNQAQANQLAYGPR